MILKNPIKAKNWKHKQGKIVCAAIYTGCLYFPASSFLVEKNEIEMKINIYESEFANEIKLPTSYFLISTGIGILLPCVAVFLTTVPTLIILIQGRRVSRRSRGEVRWQGIVTVVLTALVFCIANLPLAAFKFYQNYHEGTQSDNFAKVSFSLPMLNIMSNFYIYCLTIPSFRRFISSTFKVLATKCGWPEILPNTTSQLSGIKKNDGRDTTSQQSVIFRNDGRNTGLSTTV
jgi:hypothetical protein